MIIKHVAMRSPRKSSFGDLARYLSNPRDTSERVAHHTHQPLPL